jgi:hypothetical protein
MWSDYTNWNHFATLLGAAMVVWELIFWRDNSGNRKLNLNLVGNYLVKQKLHTYILSQHWSSHPVFSGVRVVFCAVFSMSLFIFLSFYIWSLHCLARMIYSLWYLQTFLEQTWWWKWNLFLYTYRIVKTLYM